MMFLRLIGATCYNLHMITAYLKDQHLKPETIVDHNVALLSDAAWIDVFAPSKEEEKLLEEYLKINIPTREEMLEIEISSRLYVENNVIYMTANMLSNSESLEPRNDAVTLIYRDDQLITVRYINTQSFTLFISRLNKLNPNEYHANHLIVELLDTSIDRLADILERVGFSLDNFSQTIFRPQTVNNNTNHTLNYKKLLQAVGSNGDLGTKVGESLITFNLLITYFSHVAAPKLDANLLFKLNALEKDSISLSNHVNFLSNKVNFLLDATLGMVTIEQNDVIKIFTIAAVMFLPPTLIASIYGMNFKIMPELSWYYGYPVAILLMVISSWVPYKIFKKKKWL